MLTCLRLFKTNPENFGFSFKSNSLLQLKLAIIPLLSFFTLLVQAQATITVNSVSPNKVCFSSATTTSVNLVYSVTGTFTGNTFTAQLSDASGSFTSPVTIGSLVSDANGIIKATIPANTAAGIGYLVRVVSSSPVGTSNSVSFTINAPPEVFNVTGTASTTCVAGLPVGLDGSETGVNYQLKKDGVNVGLSVPGTGSAISFGNRHQSGTYTVLATNATTGCTNVMTGSAVITTPDITVSPVNVDVCGTISIGSITLTVATGGPYEFSISNGSFQGSGNTFTFPDLSPNTYPIQVRDVNNPTCIASLNVLVQTLKPVAATLFSTTAAGCNGNLGAIKIDARNGPLPYAFSLDGGASQSSGTFTGVSAGSHSVVVTDARGCTATVSAITVAQTTPPVASLFRTTPASCNNNDGSIIIGVRGGVYPYAFSLNSGTSQASNTFNGLATGTYSVMVTDAKSCRDTVSGIKIVQPPLIAFIHSKTNVSCIGGADGSIIAGASGGKPPIVFRLTKGDTLIRHFGGGNVFNNLKAGRYTVTAADSGTNCKADIKVDILNGTVACIAAGSASSSAAKLNTYGNALKVQVFPNPSRAEFTLNLQSASKEKVSIVVADMFGKKLYQTSGSTTQRYTLGRDFKPGVYIVQVIQGKEIQTLKLIKGN